MHIAAVLGKSWGKLATEVWPNEHKIKKLWTDVVGKAIAAKTEPSRLIGKKLHVTVTSAAWMNELSFHKADILEKLKKELGKGILTDIVFKTGRVESFKEAAPKPKPAAVRTPRKITEGEAVDIDNISSTIKDPVIRAALKRAMTLGHSEGEIEEK